MLGFFLDFIVKFKGTGGAAGTLGGEGLFMSDEPDSWLGDSGTVEDGVRALLEGEGSGEVGEDGAKTSGELGDGTEGKISGPVTAVFLLLRGLGTGFA